MKRAATIATLVVVCLFGSSAFADHLTVTDGNDARGVLDVSRVHNSGGWFPKWTVKTYSRWGRTRILDQGFITIYLDTFGSDRHDYYALVHADKDRIRATLFRDRREKSDYKLRALTLRRPNRKSVKVMVPLRKLRLANNAATYNWYVQSLWSADNCRAVCFDWAPDIGKSGGGVEEPLPLNS